MSSFANLKKNSGAASLEALAAAVDKLTQKTESSSDDRYWSPTVDKAGNGYAIIRFLPAPGDEAVPFLRLFDHGFKGPGGWYIEKSLTTLGEKDPCSEYNSVLWNASDSDSSPERKQAREQKRRLSYISNIYVVKDPSNPDNDGKVFLFKYGKKIFEKLNAAMHPQFEDEKPMNPFDLWAGANFKLKIRKVDGYRNYDKSEFDDNGPLSDDDKELERIWKQEYSLQELIAPDQFKSYEELKKRLNLVLGLDSKGNNDAGPVAEAKPAGRTKAAPAQKAVEPDEEEVPWNTDDEDEGMSFFKRIAEKEG